MSFAVAIAVGPDPKELDRTADLIDSLAAYETGSFKLVMADDGETDRGLATHFKLPPDCTAASVRHPRRSFPDRATPAFRGKGICAAVMELLAWVANNAAEAEFTLKLDTDALVINPFAEKLSRVLRANPEVGMLGAYDKTPNGTPRDIQSNAATVKSLHRPPSLLRRMKNRFGNDEQAKISRQIGVAVQNGYQYGEHCLGGAYAVSGILLSKMRSAGFLSDTALWLPIDSPEDVMVGMYTRAVGMRHMNFVDRDEVFGVRHLGLADTPPNLVDRGYSVIHALKKDANFTEAEIRDFYRQRRNSRQ